MRGQIFSIILAVMVGLSLVNCSSSDSKDNSSTTYQYTLESNEDIWTEVVFLPTSLKSSDWKIKWNEDENGEITGVFEGVWGSIPITGINNGITREIEGLPNTPLGPFLVDRLVFTFDAGALNGTVNVAFTAYKDGSAVHSQSLYPQIIADDDGGDGGDNGGIGGISSFSQAAGRYQGTLTAISNTDLPPAYSHWHTSGKICVYTSNTIIELSNYLILVTENDPGVVSNNTNQIAISQAIGSEHSPDNFSIVYGAGYPSTNISGIWGVLYHDSYSPWNNGMLTFKLEGGFYTQSGTNRLDATLSVYFGAETTTPICVYEFLGAKQ